MWPTFPKRMPPLRNWPTSIVPVTPSSKLTTPLLCRTTRNETLWVRHFPLVDPRSLGVCVCVCVCVSFRTGNSPSPRLLRSEAARMWVEGLVLPPESGRSSDTRKTTILGQFLLPSHGNSCPQPRCQVSIIVLHSTFRGTIFPLLPYITAQRFRTCGTTIAWVWVWWCADYGWA